MKATLSVLVGAALAASIGTPSLAAASRTQRAPVRELRREAPVNADVTHPALSAPRLAAPAAMGTASLFDDGREHLITVVRDGGPAIAGFGLVGDEGLAPLVELATGARSLRLQAATLTEDPSFRQAATPTVRNLRFAFLAVGDERSAQP